MKIKRLQSVLLTTALVVMGVTFTPSIAQADPSTLSAPIQVDQNCGTLETPSPCTASSISGSNTTRKTAVTSDGTIFVLFSGPEGIRVSRSVDRGQNFGVASLVSIDETVGGAEIAVSSNDILYSTWVSFDGTNYVARFTRSLDRGATWSEPISSPIFTFAQSIHMAVDGDFVYAISNDGQTFWRSADQGQSFEVVPTNFNYWVYSDVVVDKITHDVYVFVDKPDVSWFRSTDYGLTFSSETITGQSIFYSVAAISSNPQNKFMYMSGEDNALVKIDLLDTSSVKRIEVQGSLVSQGRSVAADDNGNVVTGIVGENSIISFQVSNDFGETFGASVTVLESGTEGQTWANASINQTTGDLMYLYQNGEDIYFQTFTNYLAGYTLDLNVSAINFGYAGEVQSLILTNNGVTNISLDNISLSNGVFDSSTSCGASLAPGKTCNFSVFGFTAGDANILISASTASQSISRTIPVTLGAIAADIAFDPACLEIRQHVVISGSTCEGAVIIPEGVTDIGNDAFSGNSNIYRLSLPNSLRGIGDSAFANAINLEAVDFSFGLKTIGSSAFFGNTALKSIAVPNSLKSIGENAFRNDATLGEVDFGSSVQTIGANAFLGATSLASISLPNSVKAIGTAAFFGNTQLTTLDLGSGVETIGNSAFVGAAALNSVSLPNSLKTLGGSAFWGASSLTSVDFGSGIQSVGSKAFFGTRVSNVSLPASVRAIGSMAFASIPELVTIELGSAVQELANDAFEGSQSLSSFEYCGSVVNVLATLNSTGATRTTLSCSQGPKGDQGNAGPQGEKGEKGDSGVVTPPVLAAQTVKAIAITLKLKKSLVLPAKTIQGTAIVWVSKTPKICSVSKGKLVAKKVKGTCSVQATAAAKTGYKALTKLVKVSIK
jgi:hypothetical protein